MFSELQRIFHFFLIHYNNKFARWRYQRMFDNFLFLFLISNLNTFYISSKVLFEVTFKTLLCSNIWILSSNKYQVKLPKYVNLILTVTIKAICFIAYILRKNTLVLWYVFIWNRSYAKTFYGLLTYIIFNKKSLGRGSDHFIQFVLYRPLLGT